MDKWKDTNIRLSCASVMQCKKYYDQKTSCAWKSSHMGTFFGFSRVLRKFLFFNEIGNNIYLKDFVYIYFCHFIIKLHKLVFFIVYNAMQKVLFPKALVRKKTSHMGTFSCIGSLLIIVLFALRYTGT